jgi:hypothetical protein
MAERTCFIWPRPIKPPEAPRVSFHWATKGWMLFSQDPKSAGSTVARFSVRLESEFFECLLQRIGDAKFAYLLLVTITFGARMFFSWGTKDVPLHAGSLWLQFRVMIPSFVIGKPAGVFLLKLPWINLWEFYPVLKRHSSTSFGSIF